MTDVRGLQAAVFAAASEPTKDARVLQASAFAGIQGPTQEVQASQMVVQAAEDSQGGEIQVKQAPVLVAVAGRTDDPAVRAWTFTLDGHDFYVLRLGTSETLVYDMLTEQWYQWGTGSSSLWNVYHGENWIEGNSLGGRLGSNVLVGSDGNGALYFLNPDQDVDDGNAEERQQTSFLRRVTSQVPVRGYDQKSIYEVQLIGTIGEQAVENSLNSVTLSYSDDRGDNYLSAGVIDIPAGDFEARATWRSMGSFRSPGRMMRVEDFGALKRIDSLTMNSDLE